MILYFSIVRKHSVDPKDFCIFLWVQSLYTLIAILCNAVLTWLMLPWLMKLFMLLQKFYIYNKDANSNMYYMHLISATLIMVLIIKPNMPKGDVWEFPFFITCSHPLHHLVLSALEQNFGAWLLVKVSALMRHST